MLKIGDKVLCINDNWEDWGDYEYPKICHIYTIRSFIKEFGEIGIKLKEIKSPIHPIIKAECAWDIENFKKIDYNKGLLKTKEKTCNKNKINV
jgi:hypothetical protein